MDLVSLFTTFVGIAESGSISSAARKLRLSVPMASRHLGALEAELGVLLVRRTTRRLDLTEAGAELLVRARRVLRELDDARLAVQPTRVASGLLVMSAPVSFGLARIAPLVPRLLAEHPGLSVDVRFEDRVVDLLGDGVDLAIRVGVAPPDSPFLVARRLASYERILCATPALLARHGTPKTVEALARLPCLTLGAAPSRWQLEVDGSGKVVTVEGRVRSNNILALREAALSGLGLAQLPRWLVVEDLRKKRLVQVLANAKLAAVDVLGVVHADARRSNVLRVAQDFLAATLPGSLAGSAPFRNKNYVTPVQSALKDITDGTSKTLLMSEIILGLNDSDNSARGDIFSDGFSGTEAFAGCSKFMTRNTPNSGTPDQTSKGVATDPAWVSGTDWNVSARSRHPGGVNVVMCDGAVRFVSDNVALTTWQQLGNMNDAQVIADDF